MVGIGRWVGEAVLTSADIGRELELCIASAQVQVVQTSRQHPIGSVGGPALMGVAGAFYRDVLQPTLHRDPDVFRDEIPDLGIEVQPAHSVHAGVWVVQGVGPPFKLLAQVIAPAGSPPHAHPESALTSAMDTLFPNLVLLLVLDPRKRIFPVALASAHPRCWQRGPGGLEDDGVGNFLLPIGGHHVVGGVSRLTVVLQALSRRGLGWNTGLQPALGRVLHSRNRVAGSA